MVLARTNLPARSAGAGARHRVTLPSVLTLTGLGAVVSVTPRRTWLLTQSSLPACPTLTGS